MSRNILAGSSFSSFPGHLSLKHLRAYTRAKPGCVHTRGCRACRALARQLGTALEAIYIPAFLLRDPYIVGVGRVWEEPCGGWSRCAQGGAARDGTGAL